MEPVKRSATPVLPWDRAAVKSRFLSSSVGAHYGYGMTDEEWLDKRKVEYPALQGAYSSALIAIETRTDKSTTDTSHYLDYAASPPIPISLLNSFTLSLAQTQYSNPHSRSPSSVATSLEINRIRTLILNQLFGIKDSKEWDVIFTSGATGALKLVGESFYWKRRGGKYRYMKESHTSLVGIRALAVAGGGQVEAVDWDEFETWSSNDEDGEGTLFAYPAQSNVNGDRLGLEPCREVKRKSPKSMVLLDAAAYLATTALSLGSIPLEEVCFQFSYTSFCSATHFSSSSFPQAPDFIACSFYKLFVRLLLHLLLRPILTLRQKPRRAIQPASAASSSNDPLPLSFPPNPISEAERSIICQSPHHSPIIYATPPPPSTTTAIHEQFEDGTLPFLEIIALGHAFSTFEKIYGKGCWDMGSIVKHAGSLADLAREELGALRHSNGTRVVQIHSSLSPSSPFNPSNRYPAGTDSSAERGRARGPIISFTLLDPRGDFIGHVQLESLAIVQGFALRTGGLCNTGSLVKAFGVTDEDLERGYKRGRTCWDDEEFDPITKKPLGTARISFGASSTVDDVLDFVEFVRRYFVVTDVVESLSSGEASVMKGAESNQVCLETVMIYPIKSCGGQNIPYGTEWDVTPTGLAFDREWMLVDSSSGATLSQKRYPRMALIRPVIELESQLLIVSAPGMQNLLLPLVDEVDSEDEMVEARVCADIVCVMDSNEDINSWFTRFLGVECTLHRFNALAGSTRHGHFDRTPYPVPILASNESPFLLISNSSVQQVNEWISSSRGPSSTLSPVQPSCFRANFGLSATLQAFAEDSVDLVKIGTETFQVLAKCRRCLMICVDQETGRKQEEPFSCLAKRRRSEQGRIHFGVHLMWREDLSQGAKGLRRGRVRIGDPITYSTVE